MPSFLRCFETNSEPKESFLLSVDFSSTTRQNGVTLPMGAPFSICSCAASETIRRKIPEVTGQVYSAPYSMARSFLIVAKLPLFPFGI